MTSPLRRKRRITARNTPAATTEARSAPRRRTLGAALGAAFVAGGLLFTPGLGWAGDDSIPRINPLRDQTDAAAVTPVTIAPAASAPSMNPPSAHLQWRAARLSGDAAQSQILPTAAEGSEGTTHRASRIAGIDPYARRVADTEPVPADPALIDPAPVEVAPQRSVAQRAPMQPSRQPVDQANPAPYPLNPPEAKSVPRQLPDGSLARQIPEKDAYNCAAAWRDLNRKKLSDIDLDINVHAEKGAQIPHDCKLEDENFQPRDWDRMNFAWTAPGLCHKPLYFEEVQLERYGHETGPYTGPLVSAAHFFVSVPLLPYNMGLELPTECEYALGYYEPGDCAPYMIPAAPFTWRAALFEAGAAAGVAALP